MKNILNQTLNRIPKHSHQMMIELEQAIETDQLNLYYQPIISMRTGDIEGLEALVRWYHPERGQIFPGEFIPLAERSGLIVSLGNWVLEKACQQLQHWQVKGAIPAQVAVSINVSSKQLVSLNFLDNFDRILSETGLNAHCLKLELTETASISLDGKMEFLLQELRSRDIHLALDDFGTGFSSLSHLHQIPAKSLKIDRSFVQHLDVDWKSHAIVSSIVQLAHSLGMTVTAEGIETTIQQEEIKALGCEHGQGYLFSQPLSPQEIAEFMGQCIAN